MTNYTLNHVNGNTQLTCKIKINGFTESIQYEFKELLTETEVLKVYNLLTDTQKSNLTRNKRAFKQFIRSILIFYPNLNELKTGARTSRTDEAKRYVSRIAPHVNISSVVALTGYLTSGTIDEAKYNRLFGTSTNTVRVESEKLIYIESDDLITVSSISPTSFGKDDKPLYIYVIFLPIK